jgi:hypothetical protein
LSSASWRRCYWRSFLSIEQQYKQQKQQKQQKVIVHLSHFFLSADEVCFMTQKRVTTKKSSAIKPTILALAMAALFVSTAPVLGADMNLKIEVPTLNVAESHRPYVAAWIERPDQSVAANLAVWYDMKKKDKEGEKWLKDLRQWWRRSGRDQQMPVDGMSGATRPAGEQKLAFSSAKGPLANLAPGEYILMVEAAREAGGHDLVKVPFQWPPKSAQNGKGQGQGELGGVTLELKP